MLVQKHTTPYIRVFLLKTGVEIIAKVVNVFGEEFLIKDPLQMVNTGKGAQFAPLMFMADKGKEQTLNTSFIVADAPADPELERQYQEITSGIALPGNGKIAI